MLTLNYVVKMAVSDVVKMLRSAFHFQQFFYVVRLIGPEIIPDQLRTK